MKQPENEKAHIEMTCSDPVWGRGSHYAGTNVGGGWEETILSKQSYKRLTSNGMSKDEIVESLLPKIKKLADEAFSDGYGWGFNLSDEWKSYEGYLFKQFEEYDNEKVNV